MKKFFTLLAVAATAITASAQASWVVTELPTPEQVVSSVPGVTVTLGGANCVDKTGADVGAAVWKDLKSATLTVDGVEFTKYAVSGDNARGATFASGTDARVYGGFVKFVPSQNGNLVCVTYIPANTKPIIFSATSDADPSGVNLMLNGTAKLYGNGGNEVAVDEAAQATSDNSTLGYIKCALTVGNTYWFSFSGSKTAFGGFIYTPTGDAALENVGADANAPVEYFNLQGIRVNSPAQGGLYIRRQGNTVAKVIL